MRHAGLCWRRWRSTRWCARMRSCGCGPGGVYGGDGGGRCAEEGGGRRWRGEPPREGVVIPGRAVNRPVAVASRNDGTIKEARGAATIKKPDKPVGTAVAVDGPLV